MNLRNLYLFFIFIFIPIFLFGKPIINYLENINNLTYSLEIPVNKTENKDITKSYTKIKTVKKTLTKNTIIESWVVSFSEPITKELTIKLNKLGITSIITINSKKRKRLVSAIGPFVDKETAKHVLNKIKNKIDIKASIESITN